MAELTTAEVVALTGLNEGTVRKDVEHGIAGHGSPPRFRETDVVYFAAISNYLFELQLADRKTLYHQIAQALAARLNTIELGHGFLLELRKIAQDVLAKHSNFESWKEQRVVEDERILGGEPVFRGSRLAVRHIGELMRRGVRSAEIREDYPHLSDSDLEFARLYTLSYPRLGRPRDESPSR